MDFLFENRRITRSISNEIKRAAQAQSSFNHGDSSVGNGSNGYHHHMEMQTCKGEAGPSQNSSGYFRGTSEEIFLQNLMDGTMVVPSTPSIEGFMGSPALNRISSDDLFQNMLANTSLDQSVDQSPAPDSSRMTSRRMSSELAALLAQQNGPMMPRIESGEYAVFNQPLYSDETVFGDNMYQQKTSTRNGSGGKPPTNVSALKNVPWFQQPSPIMTRSRSSELRKLAEMQGLPFPPTAESLQRLASHATNDQLNQQHGTVGTVWNNRSTTFHGKPPAPPTHHHAHLGHNHPPVGLNPSRPPPIQNHQPQPHLQQFQQQLGQYDMPQLHHQLAQPQHQETGISSLHPATSLTPSQQMLPSIDTSAQSPLFYQTLNMNPPVSASLTTSSSFNGPGLGQFMSNAGESQISAVVGLLKGSIEKKKQQSNMRDVVLNGSMNTLEAKPVPVAGINHADPSSISSAAISCSVSGNASLQNNGSGEGEAMKPEDPNSFNRQLQRPSNTTASDGRQKNCGNVGNEIGSQLVNSPNRSYGEGPTANGLNGIPISSPSQHGPSPSGSSGCGTAVSADGPCNSGQTVSTLNQANTQAGGQNQSLKRMAVGSVDQPAKRQAHAQSNGNHLSPISVPNTSEGVPNESPRNHDLKPKKPDHPSLQRAGSITSSGRSGFQTDQIDDATKKRRVERQRKMAEAKGRCYIPADVQVVIKRAEALEKEVRSLKLNLAFMNRKDSEQTKQIEELEKQNKELLDDKKQLQEELDRATSSRDSCTP